MSAAARRIQYNTQVLPFINDVALEEETITPKLKYVDSDIKKSYGCSSFIDITANQVNDSWFRIDTEWGTANSNWETLTTLNWEESGEDLTASGERLNTSSTALVFAYFKNIGSNTILLSNDTGSNYLFKLSPGNALYFKASNIPVSAIFAKSASGTSALEYVLGI